MSGSLVDLGDDELLALLARCRDLADLTADADDLMAVGESRVLLDEFNDRCRLVAAACESEISRRFVEHVEGLLEPDE